MEYSILMAMKRTAFFLPVFLLMAAISASAQDHILLPEDFTLHKGDTLKVHLLNVNQFAVQDELKYESPNTLKLSISNGNRKASLMNATKENTSPIITMKAEDEGLNLISMTQKPVTDDIESDDFLKLLEDEGLTQYLEKAKNGSKDSFREKYTWYMKTLVKVEKDSKNYFDKPLNDELEIILKDNPYKGSYGADMAALVNFKGKPLANAVVMQYIKTATGNVFVEKLSTDKSGQVYFKLSREGIYFLRTLHMEPSKEKTADFDTWMASYSFGFSSTNELPNTYKEFGFGNKH